MIVDLSFLGSDLVISGVFAFLAGMASAMVYTKVKIAFADRRYRADEAVIEAVVLEYSRRLRDYDKAIADLKVKVDILEVKEQSYVMASQREHVSQPAQPHVAPPTEPVTVTQRAMFEKDNNGTTDYILKLLVEKSLASREVQLAIGRTREHTARLLKKLHDSGLVSRDANVKPFRYNITDAGRERLEEKIAPPAV